MLLRSRCPVCRRTGPSPCTACVAQLESASGEVPAVFAFHGVGRELLVALKYRNERSSLPWLGRAMAGLVASGAVDPMIDTVTWAPTHARRRRRRGYDQAELLARATARALRLPCRPLLRRTDREGPQTGRVRAERLSAPSFLASGCRGRILVVDDIVTTGATLRAAGKAVEAAGATIALLVAAAATPRPGHGTGAPMLGGPSRKGSPWRSA